MVAVVNGYVCFTTCDAEKAKQGKDPLAKPAELPNDGNKKTNGLDSQPATILDGALKNLGQALNRSGDSGARNTAPSAGVSLLV